MVAKIINGAALAEQFRHDIAQRAQTLTKQGKQPGLAVILVGENPASLVYVRNKVKACEACGIFSILNQYPSDLTEAALLGHIEKLNEDTRIHGILVQLPLPAHIDTHKILEAISPFKDVDGFHVHNVGLLVTGKPLFRPCTPYGVMNMLASIHAPLRGAHAVVVGASNIVGKPLAMLLLQAGATVTICNSKTRDLPVHTRSADILISAVGKPLLIGADMVKPGAVVIDVGINRNQQGQLCGDVDFDAVSQVAGYITPVPGGVGPMTIAMLLLNTIESAENI